MREIRDFRDLRVWQAGIKLVSDIYQATGTFPVTERFGLANQMRRSAVSIPSNIAEGNGQQSVKAYLKHIAIARGSLSELYTQIELARRLNYFNPTLAEGLQRQCQTLLRQLLALRNGLRKQI